MNEITRSVLISNLQASNFYKRTDLVDPLMHTPCIHGSMIKLSLFYLPAFRSRSRSRFRNPESRTIYASQRIGMVFLHRLLISLQRLLVHVLGHLVLPLM